MVKKGRNKMIFVYLVIGFIVLIIVLNLPIFPRTSGIRVIKIVDEVTGEPLEGIICNLKFEVDYAVHLFFLYYVPEPFHQMTIKENYISDKDGKIYLKKHFYLSHLHNLPSYNIMFNVESNINNSYQSLYNPNKIYKGLELSIWFPLYLKEKPLFWDDDNIYSTFYIYSTDFVSRRKEIIVNLKPREE